MMVTGAWGNHLFIFSLYCSMFNFKILCKRFSHRSIWCLSIVMSNEGLQKQGFVTYLDNEIIICINILFFYYYDRVICIGFDFHYLLFNLLISVYFFFYQLLIIHIAGIKYEKTGYIKHMFFPGVYRSEGDRPLCRQTVKCKALNLQNNISVFLLISDLGLIILFL